jgi:hypothetical protein
MAGFVQIISYRSARFDEVKALGEEYGRNDAGSLARRVTVTADRDRPGNYLTIVEFDSYDAAMQNSQRPETGQFAEKMQALCEGPPTFFNLDVQDSFEMS